MIVNVPLSATPGEPTLIVVYPARSTFRVVLPANFEELPSHRALLTMAGDRGLRDAIQAAISGAEEIRVTVGRINDDAYCEQRVDLDAYRFAAGDLLLDEVEAQLRAVFDTYPEYPQSGDFLTMVRKFAEDPFYRLHAVAREYLAAIDQPTPAFPTP
jgi:predicted signal transduction protein with EAL and GGDEF domain